MNKKLFIAIVCMTTVLVVSCSPAPQTIQAATTQTQSTWTLTPSSTFILTSFPTSTLIPTTEINSGHEVGPIITDKALLFIQDFESGKPAFAINNDQWYVDSDSTGNHILCNKDLNGSFISFGDVSWTNYAVEMRVKSVAHQEDPYIALYARSDPTMSNNYSAALNFVTKFVDLAYSSPYLGLGRQPILWISDNVWYLMRLEVSGEKIKYYINNLLVEEEVDPHRKNGIAGFSASSHLQICVDDIRAWALTLDGTVPNSQKTAAIPGSTLGIPQQVYPQVLANIDPTGIKSYEYKTNCDQNYAILDTCFLWDLTDVTVTTPSGQVIHLNKDFNINSYSGEITRRWVLYGPDGSELPESGIYNFTYIKNNEIVLIQQVDYILTVLPPVSNITASQSGTSINVSWQPPLGLTNLNTYKVFISPVTNKIISLVYPYDATNAVFSNLSLSIGTKYAIDVCLSGVGGSSCGKTFYLVWKAP